MAKFGYQYVPQSPEGNITDYGWYPWQVPTGIDNDEYIPDSEFDYQQYQGFLALLSAAGEWREIVTWFGDGQRYIRRCKVIWSTELLKMLPMAGQDGIFYEGDIALTMRKVDAGGIPKPGLLLESPPGLVWRILDVTDDSGVYTFKLIRNS
jgi:hypothetical protein